MLNVYGTAQAGLNLLMTLICNTSEFFRHVFVRIL